MEPTITFTFRCQQYSAKYTVCKKEYPVYIFITLEDEILKKEFGAELVVHANDEGLLVDHIFTAHRYELYNAIFKAVAGVEKLVNIKPINN